MYALAKLKLKFGEQFAKIRISLICNNIFAYITKICQYTYCVIILLVILSFCKITEVTSAYFVAPGKVNSKMSYQNYRTGNIIKGSFVF